MGGPICGTGFDGLAVPSRETNKNGNIIHTDNRKDDTRNGNINNNNSLNKYYCIQRKRLLLLRLVILKFCTQQSRTKAKAKQVIGGGYFCDSYCVVYVFLFSTFRHS